MRFFEPNLPKKGSYFQSKTDKIDTTIEFCIFELVCIKSHFKQFWIFGSNLFKKDIYGQKQKKWTSSLNSPLLKLVLILNFCLNWQFWFFLTRLAQKGLFWSKTKKVTPHIFYIILHIQISLVRNFRLNW